MCQSYPVRADAVHLAKDLAFQRRKMRQTGATFKSIVKLLQAFPRLMLHQRSCEMYSLAASRWIVWQIDVFTAYSSLSLAIRFHFDC